MSTEARVARWQQVRRLLAVRLDNLGDVLMTTPALGAIAQSLPGVHVTLLTSPAAATAAAHLPMVDAAWPFVVPWMQVGAEPQDDGHAADGSSLGQREAALIDRLAEGRFDAAVIFTVCTQSALPAALLCRLAGIPLRLAHSRENPYALLTDWCAERDQVVAGSALDEQPERVRHEVQRQLALVASVGLHTDDPSLRFALDGSDVVAARERLRRAGVQPGQPYAVLHPGATAASRRWPAERFGIAAQPLQAQGCAVVFSGGADEVALCERALQALHTMPHPVADRAGAAARGDVLPPAVSLAGELSIGELAALIAGAEVLVANNSAPAHLAAALGTPVVALYALTNPQHTPWQVASRVLHHDVPCRWCLKSACPQRHHDCLRKVEPERVADAALGLMQERAAARSAARSLHA